MRGPDPKRPYYKPSRVSSIVDSRVSRTENPRHNPSVRSATRFLGEGRERARGNEKKRNGKKETSYPANSKRSHDTEKSRRKTRRMSTAATAAYQAAQVESGIWLSRELGTLGEMGVSEERATRGGREPHLNTLACMLARSRVFLIHQENAFHLVFAPSRDSPRGSPLPDRSHHRNNVLTYWST